MSRWITATVVLAFITAASSQTIHPIEGTGSASPRLTGDAERNQWVEETLERLTLEEKVGQLLQIRVYGDYANVGDPHYRFVRTQIRQYHIGSIELSSRMAGPNLVKGSPTQVGQILNELQRNSELPLLVGGDFERGLASRLSGTPEFPFPMAFGAIKDERILEKYAAVVAEQARAVGIHWAYAPTADVNSNPDNPIINTRSFGEDPDQVSKLVAAYIRGAHRSGLIVTAKHFPGHGDSSSDSHVGLVRIDADRDHLEKYELLPFKRAIAANVDAIMLAHAALPAIDSDPRHITTISPAIVTGLLRKELRFHGLVITDALEMAGLKVIYPYEGDPAARASVDAIKAGADVLMVLDDVAAPFEALLSAVHSGEIAESRIDESVRRILTLKAALGLHKSRFVDINAIPDSFGRNQPEEFAQMISDSAVTLVKTNQKILPLSHSRGSKTDSVGNSSAKPLVVVSFSDSRSSPVGRRFEEQIKLRRPDAVVLHVYNDGIGSTLAPEILSTTRDAEEVVIAAFVTHVPSRRLVEGGRVVVPVGLMGPSSTLLGEILAGAPTRNIVIALGNPYLIENYPTIENYICTYSLAPTAEISAAKAIFGEIHNRATLPVTLPGVAERGFSLAWPPAN